MARQLRALPLLIHSLILLGLTVAGQEAATLHLELRPLVPGTASTPAAAMAAASLARRDLPAVSSSVLLAESWLRRHVLSVYPAANITSVVVGRGVLCGSDVGAGELPRWELVLPAVKNIYRSLVRWGLEREIRVSAAVPEGCLGFHDLIKALLSFLRLSGSFYLVDPETPHFLRKSPSSEKKTHSQLVSAHRDALERLGFSEMLGDAWLVRDEKPIAVGRRLSGSVFLVDPETPHFLWSSPSSEKKTHSQLVSAHRDALERLGFSEMLGDAWLVRDEKPIAVGRRLSGSFYLVDPETPHFLRKSPLSEKKTHFQLVSAHRDALESLDFSEMLGDAWLVRDEKPIAIGRRLSSLFRSRGRAGENPTQRLTPPSPAFASAPDGSFSFVPVGAPSEFPDNPPRNVPPPPCSAAPAVAPNLPPSAPGTGEGERAGLWCVAKPTVPAETLQEAMDYACGEGGGDCGEIRPAGSCYYPDNAVAHASYAFNSYWQRTKNSGGSCNFHGTAVLINSDPSFMQCRFLLG